MALANVIRTLWSAQILTTYRNSIVFPGLCNRNYDGEIAGGNTLKILGIKNPSAKTYSRTASTSSAITYDPLEDASQELKIDQEKYYAFSIKDIDMMQSNVNIMESALNAAAYEIQNAIDTHIAGLYTESTTTAGLGTDSSPLTITAAASSGSNTSVYELFGKLVQKLQEAKVPTGMVRIVVPPWMYNKVVTAGISTINTVDQGAYVNGLVARLRGLEIYVSNNVQYGSGGSSTTKSKIMAFPAEAITFAGQFTPVQQLTLENDFAQGFRSLAIWGAKVVRPSGLAVATCSEASG